MWNFTEEQFAWFGLTIGVAGFMLYMLFIVLQLAWESKAGKFGTFVIFRFSFWHAGFCGQRGHSVDD